MKRISIKKTGYGHFEISAEIRGKQRKTTTTNTIAIDNYNSDMSDRERGAMGQTRKQAAKELLNEIRNSIN